MFLPVYNSFRFLLRIMERPFKQSQLELHPQNTDDRRIHQGFRHFSFPDQIFQMSIGITSRCFQINSSGQGLNSRLGRISRRVMEIIQHAHGSIIRKDITAKSPFLPQHVRQQPMTGMNRNSIHFMISGHQTIYIGFLDRSLKRHKMQFTQSPFPHQRGSQIDSCLRYRVSDKMLGRTSQFSFRYP